MPKAAPLALRRPRDHVPLSLGLCHEICCPPYLPPLLQAQNIASPKWLPTTYAPGLSKTAACAAYCMDRFNYKYGRASSFLRTVCGKRVPFMNTGGSGGCYIDDVLGITSTRRLQAISMTWVPRYDLRQAVSSAHGVHTSPTKALRYNTFLYYFQRLGTELAALGSPSNRFLTAWLSS